MKKRDKKLLQSELSARMHYRVKCHYTPNVDDDFDHETDFCIKAMDVDGNIVPDKLSFRLNYTVERVKPYLRPMSSMTEEEEKELGNFAAAVMFASLNKNPWHQLAVGALCGDFFNKHHIDYRGLIPMGLALEAPDGMYKVD